MSVKTAIFLTGATGMCDIRCSLLFKLILSLSGYVGGTVLARLLNHPDRKSFDITALVRDESKAKTLESKFGIKPVIGSHQDLDEVATQAEAAHIVFNIVSNSPRLSPCFVSNRDLQSNADDADFTTAILKGMKTRNAKTGDVPILIHTVRSFPLDACFKH